MYVYLEQKNDIYLEKKEKYFDLFVQLFGLEDCAY